MTIIYEERSSDSPYIATVTRGSTMSDGSTIRPSEIHWHMVFVKHNDSIRSLIVGPWTAAGIASWGEGAEILWIKFKLGTFMSHMSARDFLDLETSLPEASSKSFWLKGSVWQFSDYNNVETFIERLVHDEVLVLDPIVKAALQGQVPEMSSRTVRHRFLRATGLTQNYIRQFERAQRAEALLQQDVPIFDVVSQLGYFDQPHLTRSLRQFIGYTPAQIIRMSQPDCQNIQDTILLPGYDTNVLTKIG